MANKKVYIAPKTILQHRAVVECLDGFEQGIDYKHDVWLKDGWLFSNGRLTDCQGGHFNTVADFLNAKPVNAA